MRRKDRQVTKVSEIEETLNKCKIFRVGMMDDHGIYVLPLNFGYFLDDSKLELYFHGAKTGKKVELLRENISIGFEMDCEHELIEDDNPCEYSYKYASIIGQGKATIISNDLEKAKALNFLMKHQAGSTFEFNQKMLDTILVYKIMVENFSVKRHK